MKGRYGLGILILLVFINFGYAKSFNDEFSGHADKITKDTAKIKAASHEDDIAANEYLKDRLKPIQTNFKRINSITKWTSIQKKSIEGESAEGGEATFFFKGKHLEKVLAIHYGEIGQALIEYYLLNGQLSFVFQKDYKYNRPMFYDVKAMKENNDTEAFDFKKSEIMETRNYFEKGHLFHIVNSQDCGAPFSGEYMAEEEKSMQEDFKRLMKLLKEK